RITMRNTSSCSRHIALSRAGTAVQWALVPTINAEVLILTNDANRTLVAKLTVPKYVGNKYGGDFEIGQRIAKAYGRAGEALGSYFKRTVIGKAKKRN